MLKPDKVLIVANPTAGGYRGDLLEQVRGGLNAAGFEATLHLTTHAGEIGELCKNPDFDAGILVIAGGDGSVNDALAGLQDCPLPPTLAVIPFGTANVLALELNLPRRADEIIQMIIAGRTVSLHSGTANGHPFVLMTSSGFDAEVVHALPLSLKRRFGKLAYVVTALRLIRKRSPVQLRAEVNGTTIEGKLIVVTNGRYYGGPFCVAPQASVSHPGLYLLVLERDDPLSMLRFALGLVTNRLNRTKGVCVMACDTLRLTSATPSAVQIDGDPYGTTPAEIAAAPESFAIIVP